MSDQTTFAAALLDPDHPMPAGLVDAHNAPAGRRFSVYRNNVAVALRDALEAGFPVIAKLIGADNFRTLAGVFARAHPPTSPLMMHYGADFPDFLAGFEPLKHLAYLPDTARLEQAIRESYHAADASPVSPTIFATTPPEDLANLRLTLAPSCILIRSAWPVHAIWRFNTEPNAPKPPHTAQDTLITRPEFDPVPHLLPPGGAAFITALMSGTPLGQAAEIATTDAADFDLSALLGLLLGNNAICDATLATNV